MEATGTVGKVKARSHWAATLGQWDLVANTILGPPSAEVTAKLAAIDRYWFKLEPLIIGFWMGEAWWIWEDVKLVGVEGDVAMFRIVGNPIVNRNF